MKKSTIRQGSPTKKIVKAKNTDEEAVEVKPLASPTSLSMKNSFIIQNADESFDVYYQQMRKRKHQQVTHHDAAQDLNASMNAKCGLVAGTKPNPRDGHTACVDSKGTMWVFGGDRHHMPFNDLYMIKLE